MQVLQLGHFFQYVFGRLYVSIVVEINFQCVLGIIYASIAVSS
jgi:hypothetical protein